MIKRLLDTFWVRLVVVTTCFGICLWLVNGHNWLWLIPFSLLWIYAVYRFYRLYTYNSRKVAFLLDAIENDDPAVHFYEKVSDKDSHRVNVMLNRIACILYNVKQETAQREKYYELILDFVDTGIVVFNDKGAVVQKNRKALALLGLEVFTHAKQLAYLSEELQRTMTKAMPGDKLQVNYPSERGTVNLLLRVSGIKIREENLRIIALSDINRELDEREIDSWIRLTRVLTHEIMNSLTPVTSLSETLLTLPGAADEEIRQGLETIHTTSRGLTNFVMSYRKLTRLPVPEPTLFEVRPFLERMIQLARHQHDCPNIRIEADNISEELIAFADENLMAQVVTNLLKNAIQAIGNAADGHICLRATVDEQESIRIEVANNGPRISNEVASQIFVPFFTTKEDGSGIGLSISKQIMRLIGGSLTLLPYPSTGGYTTFVLTIH